MLVRKRAEHVGAALAADDVHRRVVGLLRERQQRDDHRHQDALQRAEKDDAGEGDQRPAELDARTRRMARNSAGLISSSEDATTTAASAACGMRAMSGASSSSVASATAAVTSAASWVLAPRGG